MPTLPLLGNLGMFGGAAPPPVVFQSFRIALRDKLLSIPDLAAIVGTRIYPDMLPRTYDLSRDGPAVTYQVLKYVGERRLDSTLGGSTGGVSARVILAGWSYNFVECDEISAALWAALEGTVNSTSWGDGTTAIMSCHRSEEFDLAEQVIGDKRTIYRIISEYAIKYRVSMPVNV